MTIPDAFPALFSELDRQAAELETFGAAEASKAVRESVRRMRILLTAWWNEPLSLSDAASWGGYSIGQLRRLTKAGEVALAPNGRLRRRDVPVRPGHRLPLALEPAPVAAADWVADLVRRRELGRTG